MQDGAPTPDERQPFVQLADRKRLSLSINSGSEPQALPALWRVDMDLVQKSIDNAIVRARQHGVDLLVEKLMNLLRDGTHTQQVDFVLGDRRTYYFPEDVEKMAKSGPSVGHRYTLHELSSIRCRPLDDGSQVLEEHNTRICLIHEPINKITEMKGRFK